MAHNLDAKRDSAAAQRERLMGRNWVEPSPRWVRAYVGGVCVADSKRVLLAFNAGRPTGTYWFLKSDVRMELMTRRPGTEGAPSVRWGLKVGEREIQNAARELARFDPGLEALEGHIAPYWGEMDAWFEEDDEVFVEPRDPYHRVDVLHSSRHVHVEIDGQIVADTKRARLVFETLLPVRYYIPKLDVRMELLTPTETHSSCPYKGVASYWSVTVAGKTHADVVWGYPSPIPECAKIENLLSFYNEKVDISVDGVLLPRPEMP